MPWMEGCGSTGMCGSGAPWRISSQRTASGCWNMELLLV